MPLNFNSVSAEEVFRRLLERMKEIGEPLNILCSYDVYSVVSVGIVTRALRGLDTPYVIYPEFMREQVISENILNIGSGFIDCSGCVNVEVGDSDTSIRRGLSYVLRYRIPPEALHSLLSEFTVLPKELSYLVFASILCSHVPRILDKGLREHEEDVIKDAVAKGLIHEVTGPKLIGWGVVPPEQALRTSFDILIPKYFLESAEGLHGGVDAKFISSLLGKGVTEEDVVGKIYLLREPWIVKDLHHLAYIIIHALDVLGISAAPLLTNTNALTLIACNFLRSLRDIKEKLQAPLTPLHEVRSRQGVKLRFTSCEEVNPEVVSLTVLTRIFQGIMRLGRDDIVVASRGRDVYVPLQLVSKDLRAALLRIAKYVRGGYAVISESDLGSLSSV